MRRNVIALFTLMVGMLAPACSITLDVHKDIIVTKEVFSLGEDGRSLEKIGTLNVLFKGGCDVPYLSLQEGLQYMNRLRHASIGEASLIALQREGTTACYVTPEGDKARVDIVEQTITFDDLSAFLNHLQPNKDTYSLLTPDKTSPIRLLENRYEKGQRCVIDLKGYNHIDIYSHNEDYYLPLTTYNDLFISPTSMHSLIYGFDKVFFLSNEASFATENEEGEDVLTPLGEAFYHRTEDEPRVSEAYATFYYQNICLNFDYLYGVKGLKGRDYSSFDDYLYCKGYKDDLCSGDVRKMDAAYAYALSSLRDSHTGLGLFSPLYEYGTAILSRSKFDPEKAKEEQEEKALNEARVTSGANLGFSLDTTNRIAYIAFDDFSPVDEKALAKKSFTEDDLKNSVTLFAHAYRQITANYGDAIDYVAVDLATNNGGSAEGMLYMLGVLVGQVSIEMQNPLDHAHAKSSYAVDLNGDGEVDERDRSLRELGKTIVFIDTHYAFSCGNALPVYAKLNYPEQVLTIGEATGGGTCALRTSYTALGSQYHISSLMMLSKRNGETLESIEEGVAADICLDKELTINRTAVVNALRGKEPKKR